MRDIYDEDGKRYPADYYDHMAQAQQAEKLRDLHLSLGNEKAAVFWSRIANEKWGDCWRIAPHSIKNARSN